MNDYEKIKHLMSKARKPSVVSNYQFLSAFAVHYRKWL